MTKSGSSETNYKMHIEVPQGLKPADFLDFLARLKPCPTQTREKLAVHL